jgi:hypothetical protein
MTRTKTTSYLERWRAEQREERILTTDDDFAHYLATVDPVQVIRDAPDGHFLGMGWRELDRRRGARKRTA